MLYRNGPRGKGKFVGRAGCMLAVIVGTCACDRYPESYAPPAQIPPFEDAERWERVVHMTDVDAPERFVADIFDPLAANWRWSGKRPMLRLDVPAQEGFGAAALKYHIEFVIPQETLRASGPVTLAFLVNGHVLERRRYDAAGSYEFEKAVPPDWISGSRDVRVGAEIDKVYSSNGRTYGFLLIAMGFKRN
jgi:hypothetical protein